MFNPSRMFSWHRSFSISASWRKASVKRTLPPDGKVVLTNLKILSSEMAQGEKPGQVPPPTTDSLEGSGSPKASVLLRHQTDTVNGKDTPVETMHGATFPDPNPLESKRHLPRLAKFESEDSGVELASGPNSLSTPTGSEKSFVLHSRDSSCDSGVLSASSSPEAGHMFLRTCRDAVDACSCVSEANPPRGLYEGQVGARATSLENVTDDLVGQNPDQPLDGIQGEYLGDQSREGANTSPPPITPEGEERPAGDHNEDSPGSLQEMPPGDHPLRKYPTSDSLDEYMDECCRLSEVSQGTGKALGSGLGYLDHICQLIEKIGQLQEHNMRLQKQVCSLQKEQKMNQLKEEYFLQHCSCSTASILLGSYQEVKNLFAGKSRPHSLWVQNGNTSDLSSIPETGGSREKSGSCKGRETDVGLSHRGTGLKSPRDRRRVEEGPGEDCTAPDGQAHLPKEQPMKGGSEAHALSGLDISRSGSTRRCNFGFKQSREELHDRFGTPWPKERMRVAFLTGRAGGGGATPGGMRRTPPAQPLGPPGPALSAASGRVSSLGLLPKYEQSGDPPAEDPNL